MEASIQHNLNQKFDVVDKNGFKLYTGTIFDCKHFIRLAEADVFSVSEQDEVEYGHLLNLMPNLEWTGKLKLKVNTDYVKDKVQTFTSWLHWCNKNKRLLNI